MSYEIGDRVSMIPQTFGTGIYRPGDGTGHTKNELKQEVKPQPGTVTFIHPKRRWYQVTFDIGIKECFFAEQPPEPTYTRGRYPRVGKWAYSGI